MPADIPKGMYCYTVDSIDKETGRMNVDPCPYWSVDDSRPEQENGYCSYLGRGDWEVEHLSLLWDQVKECGENDPV